MINDWECVKLAADGNEIAWRQLIETHHSRLYRLSLLITGASAAAEDIVQESFVRVLKYAASEHQGNFRSLLMTIAYRLAIRERKHGNRYTSESPDDLSDAAPSAMDVVLNSERDRILAGILHELDDAHRDIILLRFYADHSYEEIARLLGVPIGTVKSRIFYAVKKCREGMRLKGLIE